MSNPKVRSRQERALHQRRNDLIRWQEALRKEPDYKPLQDAVKAAEQDVANLERKLGISY